jgi:hypothetical protein
LKAEIKAAQPEVTCATAATSSGTKLITNRGIRKIGIESANRLAEVGYGIKRRGYSGSEGARDRARFV